MYSMLANCTNAAALAAPLMQSSSQMMYKALHAAASVALRSPAAAAAATATPCPLQVTTSL
jgi:hypothetical protein